jgi:hypothetical protein
MSTALNWGGGRERERERARGSARGRERERFEDVHHPALVRGRQGGTEVGGGGARAREGGGGRRRIRLSTARARPPCTPCFRLGCPHARTHARTPSSAAARHGRTPRAWPSLPPEAEPVRGLRRGPQPRLRPQPRASDQPARAWKGRGGCYLGGVVGPVARGGAVGVEQVQAARRHVPLPSKRLPTPAHVCVCARGRA